MRTVVGQTACGEHSTVIVCSARQQAEIDAQMQLWCAPPPFICAGAVRGSTHAEKRPVRSCVAQLTLPSTEPPDVAVGRGGHRLSNETEEYELKQDAAETCPTGLTAKELAALVT